MAEALVSFFGFVLALFEIALQEMLTGTIKLGLRVLVRCTRESASQSEEKESKG